ncbi:hypothetical protein K431DRAFT_283396 [Polychaeton citri CBS 116435]|uniref:Uncharacterized protein n=1 Tax=Polychaeton citri CBS 116435 TaxID=1314669 RepID=A0A9P4QDD6_9PEZI|nr:hypothetical protein K431DRAFT_283396 [Polychaeton citri CBS 116435]
MGIVLFVVFLPNVKGGNGYWRPGVKSQVSMHRHKDGVCENVVRDMTSSLHSSTSNQVVLVNPQPDANNYSSCC